MADEQAKEITPSEPKKPTELVVRNSDGVTFSTRLKDSKGKFVKKQKDMPSSRELTRRGRALLFKKEKVEGQEPRTAFDAMTQYMIDAASGKLEDDPKKVMAAAQAYKVVCGRLLGKEPLSDEDRDAQKDSNVIRFVLIQPPELNDKPVKEDVKQPSKPTFIDAEIVKQD